MRPVEVDYLIIGGGIAGLTLSHFLESHSVVCLEPRPCRFKVGEAISPDHFSHPKLQAIAARARQLPSYSEKWGSIFVFDDCVAVYPTSARGSDLSMHIRRDELESLLIDAWQPTLCTERVVEIDLDRKLVRTDRTLFRVRRQILDCSGPAMVIARMLGTVQILWDVYCAWFYLDVDAVDDDAFERWLDTNNRECAVYDAKTGLQVKKQDVPRWSPSRYTYLTNVADGSWLWQIPLYGRREISFGITSVHGKVTEKQLREAVDVYLAPMFRARPKPLDGSSQHNRLHVRNHYALRAKTAATPDYVLIGDAYSFGDPIYGTGTSITSIDAIHVATTLNDSGWTPEACSAYNARKTELVDGMVAAHYFSPHSMEAAAKRHAAAVDGTRQMRVHTVNYASVIARSKVEFSSNHETGTAFESPYRSDPQEMLVQLSALLGLDADHGTGTWTLRAASAHPAGGVELLWTNRDKPALTVLLQRYTGVENHYRRFGKMALSYMNALDRPYPLDAQVEAHFDAIGAALSNWSRWESVAPAYGIEAEAREELGGAETRRSPDPLK